MIHSIYSDLPSFKTLNLNPGLNVLLAQKSSGATQKQTRNRAGKTSVVELIHFLLGGKSDSKHGLFEVDALRDHTFGMVFDLGGTPVQIERSGGNKAKIHVSRLPNGKRETISNPEWTRRLGKEMFGLDNMPERAPTFRSLFPYFARRQNSGAFTTPEKQATMQQTGDYQMALMYLLGLDWPIAADWQQVRDREKTLAELRKAASTGAFGSIIGKAADLRTQLVLAEGRLKALQGDLANFKVLDQYRELEEEGSQLTRELNVLANQNTLDLATISDIQSALVHAPQEDVVISILGRAAFAPPPPAAFAAPPLRLAASIPAE